MPPADVPALALDAPPPPPPGPPVFSHPRLALLLRHMLALDPCLTAVAVLPPVSLRGEGGGAGGAVVGADAPFDVALLAALAPGLELGGDGGAATAAALAGYLSDWAAELRAVAAAHPGRVLLLQPDREAVLAAGRRPRRARGRGGA
jgi:hypothetical protein